MAVVCKSNIERLFLRKRIGWSELGSLAPLRNQVNWWTSNRAQNLLPASDHQRNERVPLGDRDAVHSNTWVEGGNVVHNSNVPRLNAGPPFRPEVGCNPTSSSEGAENPRQLVNTFGFRPQKSIQRGKVMMKTRARLGSENHRGVFDWSSTSVPRPPAWRFPRSVMDLLI